MKNKIILNTTGIVFVIILIFLVNYITILLLNNLENQKMQEIKVVSVKSLLEENQSIPKEIDEETISEVVKSDPINNFHSVSSANSEIINMEQAINYAISNLNLFKDKGMIIDKINLNKINQTYASLLVSAPEEIYEKEESNVLYSIIQKQDATMEDEKILNNLEEKYYFWSIRFIGDNYEISVLVHAETGVIWNLEIYSQFENVSLAKSKEEILTMFVECLNLKNEGYMAEINDNIVAMNYENFNIKACFYIEENMQLIRIGILNENYEDEKIL